MTKEQLVLNWDDFGNHSNITFRQLWNNDEFTDVTLATEDGQQIKVHKVILSSTSEFFRNILSKNPHQHPLLYLKDIRNKDLEMIMKFIYQGQCTIDQNELKSFLSTGKDLGITGLTNILEQIDLEAFDEAKQSAEPSKKRDTMPVIDKLTNVNNSEPLNTAEQIDLETFFTNEEKEHNQGPKGNPKPQNVPEVSLDENTQEKNVSESVGKYHCNACDEEYSTFRDLLNHNQKSHVVINETDEPTMEKESNPKEVHSKQKHSRKVGNKNTRMSEELKELKKQRVVRYHCQFCELTFKTPKSLLSHIRIKHEGGKIKCETCDYKSSSSSVLRRHRLSKHEGVRYPCNQCDHVAYCTNNLRKHRKSKHGKCISEEICGE